MKLLCIGDSNTYGYDPQSYYGGRYPDGIRWVSLIDGWEVSDCGMNGLTIPSDSKVWQNLIVSKHPDLVSVMLGTNDLLGGCTAEIVTNRMESFLKSLNKTGIPILLIAPPVLKHGAWVPYDSQTEESRKLGRLYQSIAERMNLLFADAGEWKIGLGFDGVHFTEDGHRVFAAELSRYLNETGSECCFRKTTKSHQKQVSG